MGLEDFIDLVDLVGFSGSRRKKINIHTHVESGKVAHQKANQAHEISDSLQTRVDNLSIACLAMWELISERTNLTSEDLKRKFHEIDMRDGVADGKVKKTIQKCNSCGRTLNRKHDKCLYCGQVHALENPFEKSL